MMISERNRAARRGRDPFTLLLKNREAAIMGQFGVRSTGAFSQSSETTDAKLAEQENPFLAQLAGLKPSQSVTDPDLPACPVCQAPAVAGYLHRAWNDLAHDCDCVLEHEQAYLAGLRRIWQRLHAHPHFLANLPERYRACTLESLCVTPENADAAQAVKAGLTGNLYLYGLAGTGKSHLAVAAAASLAAQGHPSRFWGMASLFKALRDHYASRGEAPRPELHHWDVLVLDDIDKLKPTDFVYETLYELIEARWAAKKITIFTAQFDPNRAASILTPGGNEFAADPLASRMGSGRTFQIGGDDQRAQPALFDASGDHHDRH